MKFDRELVTAREEAARSVKDLSDKFDETKSSFNGDLESLKEAVHQQGLEIPRRLTMLNAEVDVHSEEVRSFLSVYKFLFYF